MATSANQDINSLQKNNDSNSLSSSHLPSSSPSTKTNKDFTLLMRLAISTNYEELSNLLQNISGEILFYKDYKGRTALDWARMKNNQQSIFLISQAISKELNKIRMEKAGYVISSESSIRATNQKLIDMLSDAFQHRDSDMILKILLDSQLSREVVNDIENEIYFTDFTTIEGDTPLIRAAGYGMNDVVIELLAMGANIDTPNRYGHNPLTWACVSGHSEVVRTLLLKGANFNHQTNEKRTCLHYACLYMKSRVVSVIFDVLFEKFSMFRVNTHPFTKYDPLRWRKYIDILENFLMARDVEDHTALDLVPSDKTIYDVSDAVFQATNQVADHIRRKSTYIPKNPFEKPDEFEKLVKMGSGIIQDSTVEDDEGVSENHDNSEILSENHDDNSHEMSANVDHNMELSQQYDQSVLPIEQSLEDHSSISGLGESKQTQHSNDGTAYFKSFLTDAYSIKSAQPQAVDIYALQNIFRLVNDRIQEWIKCSDQEYQMTLPVKCWNGCGYETKFEDMTSHVRDSCSHKPLICGDCSEVHPAYHMKHHLTKECVKRLVACPNTKIGCRELVQFHYLETHTNLRCPYRLAYCRLHCGKQIPIISRDDHEKYHCKKREISCYLCSNMIPSEDLTYHMKELCECRQVQCTKGCYEYFNIKDIQNHEENQCIQLCKWNCGERIGPLQKRQLHELTECLNRPVECSLKCGVSGLTARNQHDHERNYCQLATIICPNHCGELLLRKNIFSHLDSWHGTCPERMVRCPSNLVGWRILVNNSMEGIVLQYKRLELSSITEKISSSSSSPTTPTATTTSGNLIETNLDVIPSPDTGLYSWCANGVDMIYVRFTDRHAWIPYWTSNIIPIRVQIQRLRSSSSSTPSDGYYECNWICYSQLNKHLESECCNREVLLGQMNPLTELTYSIKEDILEGKSTMNTSSSSTIEETDMMSIGMTMTSHTTTSATNQSHEIKNNLESSIPSNESEIFHGTEQLMMSLSSFSGQQGTIKDSILIANKRHEINKFLVTPPNKIICEYCSNDIECNKLDWHIKHDCTHVLIRCKYGCGLKIPRRNLNNHMTEYCPKRNIICSKCNEMMWADELDLHLKTTCSSRLISCPNQCSTSELIPAYNLTHHLTHICEKRLYTCECGMKYLYCNRSDHLITICPKKMTLCPQGCGESITRDQLDEHMEYSCINKYIFQNKLILCPLKCGIRLKRLDILQHVTYHCLMRLVECPQRCGNTLRKEKLNEHLLICPNRNLYCEKGMPTCQFKLHQWFYCDNKKTTQRKRSISGGTGTGTSARGDDEEDEDEEDDDDILDIKSSSMDTIKIIKGQTFYGTGRLIPVENYTSLTQQQRHEHPTTSSSSSSSTTSSSSSHENDLNSIDSYTYSLAKISTSVYIENNQILMKDNLRLLACPCHGRNLLMYAIRYNETELLNYILNKIQGYDLDLQDRYGDTPLILACRLQKIPYINLLIHYGADVNIETITGKTSLIEATKINNKDIIEILISSGSIVKHKTSKHLKSAIDWANIMKFHDLKLYLDLGSVIQIQIEEIFYLISQNNYHKIQLLIQDGIFFTSNNTKIFKYKMEESIELIKNIQENLIIEKENYEKIHEEYVKFKGIYDEYCIEEEILYKNYSNLLNKINLIYIEIGKRFELYDKKISILSSYDLEEIINMRNPSIVTRIACLAYGYLFSIFEISSSSTTTTTGTTSTSSHTGSGENDPDTTSTSKSTTATTLTSDYHYDTSMQSTRLWWPNIIQSLLNKQETLKRLKNFSWVSLQSPHLLPLGQKIQELYKMILQAKEEEEKHHTSSNENITTATATAPATPAVTTTTANTTDTAQTTATLTLAQEDWDSDAEDGGDGEWVKGQWVGRIKKKSKWWELKKHVDDGDVPEQQVSQSQPSQQQQSSSKKKRQNIVKISEILSELENHKNQYEESKEEEKKEETGNLSENNLPPPSTTSTATATTSGTTTTMDDNDNNTDNNIYIKKINKKEIFTLNLPFVDCMIILMKAVSEMIDNLSSINQLNSQLLQSKFLYEEKKINKEISKQKYDTINSKYLMLENNIKSLLMKLHLHQRNILKYKERLRISRLLNHITSCGHSVISWAACNGCYDIVELLLSKGATVGYNEDLLHLSAEIIQITFKLFYYHSNYYYQKKLKNNQNTTTSTTSSHNNPPPDTSNESDDHTSTLSPEKKSIAELMNIEENHNNALGHNLEEVFTLRKKRDSLIFRVNRLRRNFRFPIPEAAYAGHSDIIERIYERKLLHMNFIGSWIYPSPPPPRPRYHYRLNLKQKKFTFLQLIKDSKNNFSAGILTSSGWLSRYNNNDPYIESYKFLKSFYQNHLLSKILKYREERYHIHQLVINKKQQEEYKLQMTYAIKTANFYECIRLAINDYCSIDYETNDGLTALIVASEENISGLHHQYIRNDDNQPVLAVCYLLDRKERSPAINIETKYGNLPLLHACALGREYVVEALLDRYAEINRQNKFGQAALHIAAINGSVRCTKLLLERGAIPDIKDNNGKTPYDLALENGFTSVLNILGQYRGGFLGEITGKRGTINETIGCPSGCGVILHRHEIKEHLPSCILRTISCPLECSDPNIIARDLNYHLQYDCLHRLIECNKCHEYIRYCDLYKHNQQKCIYRLIQCTNIGCEQNIEAKNLIEHQKNCLYKIISCPELCGETYPIIKRLLHIRNSCKNRRILCPNQCNNFIIFHTLQHHLNDICPRRFMTCQWCKNSKIEYQYYIQHELSCTYRLIPCENHCQQLIQVKDTTHHLLHECTHRFVDCKNKCELKIREIDMETHLQHECGNRIIECPSGCMNRISGIAEERTKLLAKHLSNHLKNECLERIIPCGLCSITMKAKDLSYHTRNECEYRQVSCRNNGCKKIISYHLLEKHERNECKYRFLLCPTGCGTAIIAKKLNTHLTTVCGMRYIPCTLGCGMEIRQSQIGMHLQYECKKRPIRSQTMRYSSSQSSMSSTSTSTSNSRKNENNTSTSMTLMSLTSSTDGTNNMNALRGLSRGNTGSNSEDIITTDSSSRSSPIPSPIGSSNLGTLKGSRKTLTDLDALGGKMKVKKFDSIRNLPPISDK